MRFLFKLLSRLSLDALYRIVSRPFFDWGYHILRWRRRLAADNIARSFPELSAEARAAILKQSYRNLCDIAAEIIWGYGASPEDLRKRVGGLNPEVWLDRIRAGQSILLMTAHYCNWEWQVLAANTWLEEPMFSVYKTPRGGPLGQITRRGA